VQLLYRIYNKVSPWFRRKRMRWFKETFPMNSATRLLDVGGYAFTWKGQGVPARITLLNPHVISDPRYYDARYEFVVGDGCALQYADQSWEVLYSNSVIEHLATWEKQQAFAAECRRVGRNLWIQTPALEFPIEPHFLMPFFHFLPNKWRKRLARHFTPWGWLSRASKASSEAMVDEIRLLKEAEMKLLFPDCEIRRERLLGLTKSYVAVRKCLDK